MAVVSLHRTPARTPQLSGRTGRRRILFVDDDSDTASAMSRLLMHGGHEVCSAGSVGEAVGAWAAGSFDLLISDIGLPDGTGRDILREISRNGPVKAIVISGHGSEEDIRESRCAGFVEHLVKPVSFKDLEAAIRRVVD